MRHKERLKELRAAVHVLTLSATPIPRTLQLALTGVRDLSMIATPPIDRLAVRTFIAPFDTLTIREALIRERLRGGQSFYVVPRISDLAEVHEFLEHNVPEAKVGVAHGQMPPSTLDKVMNAFYEGQYDILLSTTIIESGLDIPRANTLVVHRSEMFGLAQLYQLRGRIGRSKLRAYALFTVPAHRKLTETAARRLKVLQSLDTLGAGFQLASHDLDIRGAGNLLGEEQSGHIKEVGFELYQEMLEEAVASLKAGGEEAGEERWSPQITIGMAVMIPESYVPDLQLRMQPLPAARRARRGGRDRRLRRRADRPLRAAAGGGRASSEDRVRESALPPRQRGEGRRRAEGRRHRLPRQYLREPAGADPHHPGGGDVREDPAGPAGAVCARMGKAGGKAEGGRGDFDEAGGAGGGGEESGLGSTDCRQAREALTSRAATDYHT